MSTIPRSHRLHRPPTRILRTALLCAALLTPAGTRAADEAADPAADPPPATTSDATPRTVAPSGSGVAREAPPEPLPPPEEELGPVLLWSATVFGQYRKIDSPYDRDRRAGFFDQYEFTPSKGASVPLQLGVREASLDWIEDDEPRIQLRYASPTSNLDLNGGDLGDSFLDQRALLLGRSRAFQLDLDYWRFRTEQLRVYPETDAGGGALPYDDLTQPNDRFYRDRTGFRGELRWRLDRSLPDGSDGLDWLSPELALRGGYDRREGRRQQQTLLNPANDWVAFSQDFGDDVSDVGGGLLVAPGGLFTMTFDFDYQDYAANQPQLDDTLPFPPTSRSLDFVPSSNRKTGEAGLHMRFGERAVVTAAFQATVLDQESPRTPRQQSVGLDRNKASVYSARIAGDLRIARDWTANAFAKYVFRDREIDQNTPLFGPTSPNQVDEFLDSFQRIDLGAESVYRPWRGVDLALGLSALFIDRDLDFAQPGLGNAVILPANAWVNDHTQMWTVYGRAQLRPFHGLGVRAELSYRNAPDTGYVTDLDDYVEGSLRASYVVPVTRPTTVTFHLGGGSGKNSQFTAVEGVGATPSGPSRRRDYERSHWTLSLSGDSAVRDDLSLFASLSYAEDEQSDQLLLSNIQRYFQDSAPIQFRKLGGLDCRTRELGFVLGSQLWLTKKTDAGLSYSFTWAETKYLDPGSMPELALIGDNRIVDAHIHGLDLELRHQIRKGLRVFAGYRLQLYEDGAPKPSATGSVQRPGSRTDLRHTVSVGVSLNSDLLSRPR